MKISIQQLQQTVTKNKNSKSNIVIQSKLSYAYVRRRHCHFLFTIIGKHLQVKCDKQNSNNNALNIIASCLARNFNSSTKITYIYEEEKKIKNKKNNIQNNDIKKYFKMQPLLTK